MLNNNSSIPILDIVAIGWFAFAWVGYAFFASQTSGNGRHNLIAVINNYRLEWMRVMLRRENRIPDITSIGNLLRSIAFFASTSIILQLGFFTMFGYRDQAIGLIETIPFASAPSAFLWEIKIFLLAIIFVYAFFKFTWSLRQYNYACIYVCSCPLAGEVKDPEMLEELALRGARLITNAAGHFNLGMRAYYYGLAVFAWFIHPVAFILATTVVVSVLFRREFRSFTHNILSRDESLRKIPAW